MSVDAEVWEHVRTALVNAARNENIVADLTALSAVPGMRGLVEEREKDVRSLARMLEDRCADLLIKRLMFSILRMACVSRLELTDTVNIMETPVEHVAQDAITRAIDLTGNLGNGGLRE